MKNAYTLLGMTFLFVFGGAFVLLNQAHAPTVDEELLGVIENTMPMKLTSTAFEHGATIPSKYTCDGEGSNPPLSVSDVPEGTKSFVVVMDDSDLPQEIKNTMGITKFNHWVEYNIPITEDGELLPENYYNNPEIEPIGIAGKNSRGEEKYSGPCPPPQYEPKTHAYVFRVYALSKMLMFDKTPTLDEVEDRAKQHMLQNAELVGYYTRMTQ